MLTKSEIHAMTVEERMKLAEMLWESVETEPVDDLPEWQKKILEERLKDMEENPGRETPWEEVLASLKARHKHA